MKKLTPKAIERCRQQFLEEMDLIKKCGYCRYFLIVQDLLEWCAKNNILIGPGRGCFLPNNKVVLSNGKSKKIKDIDINDEIISHKKTKEKVTNKFKYEIEEEIIELDIEGTIISCTGDHKILTTGGWKRANKIIVGDKIVKVY